ncbi:MAG: alanine racemase [Magnetococcales bacterium]|nr:alanine racemase [Magnetococcales bacterium]
MNAEDRPTWLSVDLDAVAFNFHVAKTAVGDSCQIRPVIKADAYGLGAIPVARRLRQEGVGGFCVALVEEAVALREAGIQESMVVMSGFSPALTEKVVAYRLEPFLTRAEYGLAVSQRVSGSTVVPVYLKVDTGMGRLGVPLDQAVAVYDSWTRFEGIHVVGVVSHLACADDPDNPETDRQIKRFASLVETLRQRNPDLVASLSNSAGIMAHPGAHFDWVRPGVMLYGGSPLYPHTHWQALGLRQTIHWVSHIVQIQNLSAGRSLGYGHTFTVQRVSRIAWISVGYGDGYNRHLSNRGAVVVGGVRCPVVGRVCMDLIGVDVTDVPTACAGDPVALLGGDAPRMVALDEMAQWLDTLSYEVSCAIGQRVPRRY